MRLKLKPHPPREDELIIQLLAALVNSLAPGRSSCDFKNVIFNIALLIGIFKSYDNVLR